MGIPTHTPNDTFWDRQWYMRQIHAPEAWAVTTGTKDVIVAVIDTGVDIGHEDLKENIWTNTREVPGNGIDDDGDGYVDDVHGWNYVTKKGDVRPVYLNNQYDEAWSHGTLVASLLAARGDNNIGIAGMAWNVRVMPLVVLDGNGEGSVDDIMAAIRYAVSHGASVINMSLTSYENDPQFDELVRNAAAANVVVVAATGNGEDISGINIDQLPTYPACSDAGQPLDSVIGVSGTDTIDQKAPYANFGRDCTDISAPAQELFGARPSFPHGVGVTSTVSGYIGDMVGTSLAAPLVSGVAALLKSAHPEWTARQIRDQILRTADGIDGSSTTSHAAILGMGRLNAGRALTELPTGNLVVSTPLASSSVSLATAQGGTVTIQNGSLVKTLKPYGSNYRGDIQILSLANGGWLFWPSFGGGQAVATDANGNVKAQGFPFGKKPLGKWMVSKDSEPGVFRVRLPSRAMKKLRVDGFTWSVL